ncbi:MAG: pyruvate formate lyase family protein [Desulfatiglans sp.]|jgi:formate C-acetyltransferase|nr:pyruvate formate lyase family protein [Thermodesulfobacteriota bacterium]MEE4352720.1 pyruvate formate lyase family protein [Desulfatiglans sp.]
MSTVTLKDIRLRDYSLEDLPLLKRLKEDLLSRNAEVCIERAKYVTEYLKDLSTENEPMETRYAKALAHFLAHKEALFFDDSLLAGTTTSKPFGAPVYPELTGMTIWPELDTISTRDKNPLLLNKAEHELLNFDIFPYWMERNILEYTRTKQHNPECMRIFERLVFFIASKAGCISHTVPDYKVALEKGLEYLIGEAAVKEEEIKKAAHITLEARKQIFFYRAVQIALEGAIAYGKNLSKTAAELAGKAQDPLQKENFSKMAEICKQVPAKPARTLREAINSLWIIQVAIHAENINMAMSPGRLDQILYRYYEEDRRKGSIDIKEALELVGCLWLKLNDNTNLVPETAEELFGGAGTVPAVTVGGIDERGEDAVNDLTYIMLKVTEILKTRDPSLNARYHYEKNPEEYRDRVAEVIVNTKAVPAIHNDVVDIKVLENQGIRTEHARDYAVIGCVELASAGRSYDASSSIMLNLVSVFELAMNNGKRPVTGDEQIGPKTGDPCQFQSFEQFWEAYKRQLEWLVGEAIELNEYFGRTYQEILPSPLLSSFFEGPLQQGTDLIFGGALYNSSGATHIGFADTVDSLNALEKAVFQTKKCTFKQLMQALEADFKGHEELHAYLLNKTPKYGTDDPLAKKNSQNLIRFLYDLYQGYTNYRGGKYRPGYWTMTNHAGQGKLSGALPNGRKANEVFASGITPVSQAARDLSTCLQSVGGLESSCIPSGEALNLKYPYVRGKEDLEKFSQAIEAYVRCGGLHIQFNIMSYEDLIDAKSHPEKYKDLLVRVSGYSAYFNDLNEAMKDEIITRTAYNVGTGQAAPFPENYRSMLATE